MRLTSLASWVLSSWAAAQQFHTTQASLSLSIATTEADIDEYYMSARRWNRPEPLSLPHAPPSFCRRSISALTPHDPVPPSSDTAQSQKQGENFDNHEMYIGSTSRLPLPSFYHPPASSYSPYTLTNKLVSTLARRAELPTRKCRRIKDRNRHPGHVRTPS